MENNSDITAIAKAAAESAKFGTQAVQTSEKILKGIAKILREPMQDASGVIGDRLKFLRWERQLRYIDRYNEILDSRGIKDTKAVPPKFALPLITNASLEEDDILQDLWARLTASAMDPNFKNEIRYAYIEIIKNLTPLDVRILNAFYEALIAQGHTDWNNVTSYSLAKEQICEQLKINEDNYLVSIYNLFRVQCMAPAVFKNTGIQFGNEPTTIFKGADAVTLTPLGIRFIQSCITEKKVGI